MYQDKVVGETTIQLVEPEEISFSGTGVSLNFNDSSDLGPVRQRRRHDPES